jgi:hypothetical protein
MGNDTSASSKWSKSEASRRRNRRPEPVCWRIRQSRTIDLPRLTTNQNPLQSLARPPLSEEMVVQLKRCRSWPRGAASFGCLGLHGKTRPSRGASSSRIGLAQRIRRLPSGPFCPRRPDRPTRHSVNGRSGPVGGNHSSHRGRAFC